MRGTQVNNFINGEYCEPEKGKYMDVTCPSDGDVYGKVYVSGPTDLDTAVKAAEAALPAWSGMTTKSRVKFLFKFRQLLEEQAHSLAQVIVAEHGKTEAEALAEIAKGMETVEYAISMPQLISGSIQEVSRNVSCRDVRSPVGIVASIVPFNFPIMVPLWTLPIALACGNCFILKPSEKVPTTMFHVATLLRDAGLPAGVFQIVNGTAPIVEAICDHPAIKAVTFVGSTKVAQIVSQRCSQNNKRVLALGGAKNHLVALPDCNLEMAANDIVRSFAGCSGQRCMAASVLLTIGPNEKLLERIVQVASKLQPGSGASCMGPIIDKPSLDRILHYIEDAKQQGATILLDGRSWLNKTGYWIGPTVILHKNKTDKALHDEIFGPVLSVYATSSKEEAIAIENDNPYGNAACIYTSVGEHADWFSSRFQAAMIGVNVGVPVPREPFSFGGMNASKFGCGNDITGDGGIEFFTTRRKVTTKWNPPQKQDWMS